MAPSALQNASQLLDRRGVRAVRRRQDAPAVDEQLGEAGVRAGILRAGDRMRRDEMHALRHMRRHVLEHRALDRADIGDDRAGLQRRGDLGCATGPLAPTGMQTMTRSASFAASALVSTT